jgi:hypothetical protein
MSEFFFKTLLVVATITILFYLVFSYIRKTSLFEGMENNSETNVDTNSALINSALQKHIETLKKKLSIDKNQKEYEDLIMNLEDVYNLTILSTLYNGDPLNQKVIDRVNSVNNAKSALNGLMKFVDNQ